MVLRPYGLVINGCLEIGLELVLNNGVIEEIRPHTAIPDHYIISPAFVNAHSHLEYRGLQGKLTETEYWPWIREITALKQTQTEEEVRADCLTAAKENRATGVALIGEHSDRPFAGEALAKEKLGGIIFQEVITFLEHQDPKSKLESIKKKADQNRTVFDGPVYLSPHAPYTVDSSTLAKLGKSGDPLSIHVAETPLETEFFELGTGPIADLYNRFDYPFKPTGKSVVETLSDHCLVRKKAQFVHCCALRPNEIDLIAGAGVTVAHCPRSNVHLKCPSAPIRELLDAGVLVGLGLDSAASSGPFDMFAEMGCALRVSRLRGRGLEAEEVWQMATSMGARSLPLQNRPDWEILPGSSVPLIKLNVPGAQTTEDLIEQGSPERVEWI